MPTPSSKPYQAQLVAWGHFTSKALQLKLQTHKGRRLAPLGLLNATLFLGVISGFLGVECKRESGPHLSNFFEGCVQGFESSSSPSTKLQLGLWERSARDGEGRYQKRGGLITRVVESYIDKRSIGR